MKNFLNKTLMLLAALSFSMVSCTEEPIEDASLSIDGESTKHEFNAAGGEHSFIVRSNLAEWELIYLNEESEWLKVWPKEGDYDGRFTVTAPVNDEAYPREAVILLVSRGEEQGRFNVTQKGNAPYLNIASSSDVNISCLGSLDYKVSIESNVEWRCSIPASVDWVHLGEATAETQQIIIDENNDAKREGSIKFTMIGTGNEAVTAEVKITQLDRSSDPNAAALKTIAEVLEDLNYSAGLINNNIKIECEVTADYSGNNITRNQLFVQDNSGHGLVFNISDTAVNTYEPGDKLTIHMLGKELIIDATGAYFLGFSADSVLPNDSEEALNVAPVAIASISELNETMVGTLVSLSQVEYAVPYGAYANFDEGYYGKTVLSYTPILLQDSKGDTVISRVEFGDEVEAGATFKYSRYLPKGSGEFVGLVLADVDGLYIKMRTLADDKITDENRMWRHAVEFYWVDRSVINYGKVTPFNLEPATGEGTWIVDGPTSLLYNSSYSYVRTDLSVSADADVKGENTGILSTYQAANTAGAGWSTYYTGSNASSAAAWVATTSTAGASEVAISISTSSSATGPGEFIVLYSTDNGASYKEAGTYESVPWNTKTKLYFAGTLGAQVVLPSDAANCENLIIRLTPRSKLAADPIGYTGIGSGGTNRVAYFTVMVK